MPYAQYLGQKYNLKELKIKIMYLKFMQMKSHKSY